MVMVLTMFMMILTMVMILEEEYLKMINCDKVGEEWEDILNLDRGALLQELHRQLDVVLLLDNVPGDLSHRIKQQHIQEERQRHKDTSAGTLSLDLLRQIVKPPLLHKLHDYDVLDKNKLQANIFTSNHYD